MKTLTNPLRLLALLCCAAILAGCAGMAGPRQVELPLSKLQAGVERHFPLNNKMLELFNVELSRPQVRLMPDSGRVGLAMDASVAPPFLRQSWRGQMALSGRLYIDAARGAVLMAEPRVERFVIDGVDGARQREFAQLANLLMAKVAADIPVYSFRTDELRYAGVQFVPTNISTTASGLVVTVEPVK